MIIRYLQKRKRYVKILINVFVILLIIITIPYYQTNIFRFSEPEPFSGNRFYNPYAQTGKMWVKANFHAHTQAFGGITKGKNTQKELIERYTSLGYQILCISNYNQAAQKNEDQQMFFSAYEHGYNINWAHQLVLNAQNTSYFDFPLFQSKSHKQRIINKLIKTNPIIVLSHPSFKHSYEPSDLKYLVNYDFIEGISPVANSIKEWDYALSNGHAVWIMGNDDAHEISNGNNGICWTMINTDSLCADQVFENLKKGNCYATKGWLAQEMNRIISLSVKDNAYELTLEKAADSIILKSDMGKTVAIETNKNNISYTVKPENTYIRAEIFDSEPYNQYTKTYLNPIIRIKGESFIQHNNDAKINVTGTFVFIIIVVIIHAFLIVFLWIINFKKPA